MCITVLPPIACFFKHRSWAWFKFARSSGKNADIQKKRGFNLQTRKWPRKLGYHMDKYGFGWHKPTNKQTNKIMSALLIAGYVLVTGRKVQSLQGLPLSIYVGGLLQRVWMIEFRAPSRLRVCPGKDFSVYPMIKNDKNYIYTVDTNQPDKFGCQNLVLWQAKSVNGCSSPRHMVFHRSWLTHLHLFYHEPG